MFEELSELIQQRLKKMDEFEKAGMIPFAYRFDVNSNADQIKTKYESIQGENENQDIITIAGRIITKRGHGKACFVTLQDASGRIQIYGKVDVLGADKFKIFEKLDMGDIIGVSGKVFRTKRGELTLKIQDFKLLTKSLHPLPEKWHGLQDKELRYRERYVDLIVNPDVKNVFVKRSKIISYIRKILEDRGFIEVETPILHPLAGGAAAKPFKTFHNALDMELFLRIAPELYLKRLLVGEMEKVFEIGRVFRNEGMSYKHNPEYTMLEVYQAYADYTDIMQLTEDIVVGAAQKILGTLKIEFKGQAVDLTPPWKKITLLDALKEKGIDLNGKSEEEIYSIAKAKGIKEDKGMGVGKIINLLYDKYVESTLIQPTFIIDHPLETSPLAKKHRDKQGMVERFELIIAGMELANAFSELNDPIDQKARFNKQVDLKAAGDEEAESMDEDFLRALEYGMPPAGGLGIGIDRLIMILTNQASIRDVLFFPHMRPLARVNPQEEEIKALDKNEDK